MREKRKYPATIVLLGLAFIGVAVVAGFIGYSLNHHHSHDSESATTGTVEPVARGSTDSEVADAKASTEKTTQESARNETTDNELIDATQDESIQSDTVDSATDSVTNESTDTATSEASESAKSDSGETSPNDIIEAVTNDDDVSSPLTELLGLNPSNQSSFAQRERLAQESVKNCMADKGFEYIPVNPNPSQSGAATDSGDESTLEYAQQSGYGITDSLEQGLNTFVNGEAFFEDPNEKLRANLPDSEAQAYDEALSGFSTNDVVWRESDGAPVNVATGQVLTETEFINLSKGSCLREAYSPENEAQSFLVSDLLGSDAYRDLQIQIQNDPRMTDLQVDWSRCMAAEGYDFGSSREIKEGLYSKGNEIAQNIAESGGTPDSAEISNVLASHKSDEIQLAVADWNCSVDFVKTAPAIVREYEINFIQENEALILEILAAREN